MQEPKEKSFLLQTLKEFTAGTIAGFLKFNKLIAKKYKFFQRMGSSNCRSAI